MRPPIMEVPPCQIAGCTIDGAHEHILATRDWVQEQIDGLRSLQMRLFAAHHALAGQVYLLEAARRAAIDSSAVPPSAEADTSPARPVSNSPAPTPAPGESPAAGDDLTAPSVAGGELIVARLGLDWGSDA